LALVLTWPTLEHSASAALAQRGLAVSSEAPRATQEAMSLLARTREPGNAADAAIVAALVAGVVSPSSSGIGGGGFVNHWDQSRGTSAILDFREVAPALVDSAAFEARPFAPEKRALATGVPGEVRGLYELHLRHGRVPWPELVGIAAGVAERGFAVSPHLAKALERTKDALALDPGSSSLWLQKGRLPAAGVWVKNPRLGKTLRAIAERGPSVFYEGPIAEEIVATARAHGSQVTTSDLANYRVKERAPLALDWHGYRIHTMPPPSAGGYTLAHALGLYEPEELSVLGFHTPAYVHAVTEALRAAIADRMLHFGDPDHVNVDLATLLAPERLARRRQTIALDRTHALPRFVQTEDGTHHLVVRDAAGNVVSLTTTVNTAFGAKLVTEQSGIALNDELTDFTKQAWVAPFGLEQSPNRPRGGARALSSMAPTIVTRDGAVVLALGGSGGLNIATDVTQVLLHALLFGPSAKEAVEAPRAQIPFEGTVRIKESLGAEFVRDLEARGEVVSTYDTTYTAVQLLAVKDGVVSAAADPQKGGLALVR
jgi:gamma-glutamyltranspeptidase/glutathione hydrolase